MGNMGRLIVIVLVMVCVATGAWLWRSDVGLTISISFAFLYSLLWTLGVPEPEWILLPRVRDTVDTKADIGVPLDSPCPFNPCTFRGSKRRHFHFSECLVRSDTKKLSKAYGFTCVAETFICNAKYRWLFGGLGSAFATFVFIVMSREEDSTTAVEAGKITAAIIIGTFHIGATAFSLIWFRKQAERLLRS